MEAFRGIGKLTKLTTLSVSAADTVDESPLDALPNLRERNIYYITTYVTIAGQEYPSYQTSFSLDQDLTESDIEALCKLTHLESINITSDRYMEDFSFLANLTNLEEPNLERYDDTSFALGDLSFLSNMRSLKKARLYLSNLRACPAAAMSCAAW